MEVKKEFSKEGKLLSTTPYFNGKRHGLHQTYSSKTGLLSQMVEILDHTGDNWDYYEFYETGGLKFRMPMRNRKRNGVCLCWYEDGVLLMRDEWKDDNLNGLRTEWHPNGQKKQEATFVDDKIEGIYTRWNEQGEVVYSKFHIRGEEQEDK